MKNERQIRPLRKYEVEYVVSIDQRDNLYTTAFTADDHDYDGMNRRMLFYNAGNVIREIHSPITQMIITPVDESSEVPK